MSNEDTKQVPVPVADDFADALALENAPAFGDHFAGEAATKETFGDHFAPEVTS